MARITNLTEVTPAATDVVYIVDDPGGTPASGKATISGLLGIGAAVGDPVRSGTANRVLYEDGSNNLAETANLTFGATNLALSITAAAATDVVLELNAASGQSANAFVVKDNAGAIQFGAGSDGEVLMIADKTTDVAPTDDTSLKKVTLQRLTADPTSASFLKFSQSPGTPTNDFYLVLEEG